MAETKIEWVIGPDGSRGHTVNPIRFRNRETGRLASAVQCRHLVSQFRSRFLDFIRKTNAWSNPLIARKPNHQLGVGSLDDHKRKNPFTQEFCALSMEPNDVLRLPLRVSAKRRRIVELDRPGVYFRLDPLDDVSVGHSNSEGWVEGIFFRADMRNTDTPLSVYQPGQVRALQVGKAANRILWRGWLTRLGSQVLSLSSGLFRRIDLSGWHKLIVALEHS